MQAAARGHRLVQSGESTGRVLADAGQDRRHGLERDGRGDGLVFIEYDRRQAGGATEPISSTGSADGLDLVPEVPERIDIATYGSHRRSESGGEFLGGQGRTDPEDRQQLERPRGGSSHDSPILSPIAVDRKSTRLNSSH